MIRPTLLAALIGLLTLAFLATEPLASESVASESAAADVFAERGDTGNARLIFEGDAFWATGFRPGARLYWFGITKQSVANTWMKTERHEGWATAGEDALVGTLVEPGIGAIPPFSIWLVVDPVSGDLALARADGRPNVPIGLEAITIVAPNGDRSSLELSARTRALTLFWLRAGGGLFSETVGGNGQRGAEIALGSLVRLDARTDGGLRSASQGDVAVVLDPIRLKVSVLDVAETLP